MKIPSLLLAVFLISPCLSIADSSFPNPPVNAKELAVVEQYAQQGNSEAQFQLAMALRTGHLVKKNDELFIFWLLKAASSKHILAISNLSAAYLQGIGVPIDFEEAFKWAQIAADNGNQSSQITLSNLYLDGKGVGRNYSASYFWALLAASHPRPKENIGAILAWEDLTTQAKILLEKSEAKLDQQTIIKLQNEVFLMKQNKPIAKPNKNYST